MNRGYGQLGSVLLSLLMMCCVTGCWSKVEINEQSFVTGVFIDKSDTPGEVEVTMLTPLTNRLGSSEGGAAAGGSIGLPYATVTKSGSNILEALEKIQIDITRKLSWGHTRVVVFGQDYAKSGIRDAIEWISREPLFHISSFVMVASGKAKDVTNLAPVFEGTPTEVLREFSNKRYFSKTQVRDVRASDLNNQGFVMTMLEMKKEKMNSEGGKVKDWASQTGGAIFEGMKMRGTLNIDETKMVSWVRRELKNTVISVQDSKESATVNLYDLDSNIQVIMRGGKPLFRILLSGKANLSSFSPKLKTSDVERVQRIQKMAGEEAIKRLDSALEKAKMQGSDILVLGYRLEWKYPQQWKALRSQWPEYVKYNLKYEIATDINIQFYGAESSG